MTDTVTTTQDTKQETTAQTQPTESRFFIVNKIRKVTNTLSTTLKDYKNTIVKPVIETGKEFRDGVSKDAHIVMEELRERTKTIMPESSILKSAKEKVTTGLNKIKEQINKPDKKDGDNLNSPAETVTPKAETLDEKPAA